MEKKPFKKNAIKVALQGAFLAMVSHADAGVVTFGERTGTDYNTTVTNDVSIFYYNDAFSGISKGGVNGNHLLLQNDTNLFSAYAKSLLYFDLTGYTATGLTVSRVKLFLGVNNSPHDFSLYEVSNSWTESATWETTDGTILWSTEGGDFNATASATNQTDYGTSPPDKLFFDSNDIGNSEMAQ